MLTYILLCSIDHIPFGIDPMISLLPLLLSWGGGYMATQQSIVRKDACIRAIHPEI